MKLIRLIPHKPAEININRNIHAVILNSVVRVGGIGWGVYSKGN